jgi:hypothetical protein
MERPASQLLNQFPPKARPAGKVGRLPRSWVRPRQQRTVNPPIVPTRYNFLYSSSRPALRTAACGGRPRAGNDTTVTRRPA